MYEEQFYSRSVPVNEGAEAFIELLNANGVDNIFLSPGSDVVSIQEAIARYQTLGKPTPRVILCLDESVGLAAAHGYFAVSGRPQVVIVHADLGTQQLGGALHNAQRDHAGVILCAGRTQPVLEEDKPFRRKSWVQWMTEKPDQTGIVRDYVKWYYELRTNRNIHLVVQRAFQIASTEPCGPVYLILPPELLIEKIDHVLIPDLTKYKASVTPQADGDVLELAAEVLTQAESPLLITGYSGRYTKSVASLVELAEVLCTRVVTYPHRMNFPNTHPLWFGIDPDAYLSNADVILVIDQDVPFLTSMSKFNKATKVIQIDIDPVKKDMPTWFFPADFPIQADSSKAIPALTKIIRQKIDSSQRVRLQERFQRIQKENDELRAKWHNLALEKANQKPISPELLCHYINEVVDENTIMLNELPSDSASAAHHIKRTEPGTLFDKVGSSLGWGLGAALGAKLATPDKMVVVLVGDGSFVYGCPTAALWASQVHCAPFLCIIFCNRRYVGVKKALRRCYGKDSVSERKGAWVGFDITPPPDYSLIAQACGAWGKRVEEPDEILPALKDAFSEVRSGRTAVLEVRTAEVVK